MVSGLSGVDLSSFNKDFQALMEGLGRDVAPSLRLGALAGDLQGDASIDHFSVDAVGIGSQPNRWTGYNSPTPE